ncbi:MAG: glycosyltransferase [Bacteroidales bacterium]|nr:glycosyltransferase [Bacteroidales bacterium]
MNLTSKNSRIVFSVTNCICFDQRVLKMANTVSSLNCDITIVGRKKGICCDSDSVPFRTKRFGMLFRRGFLFYKWFNIRLFIYLLFNKFDILVANDLDTLLPNYIISKLKGLPLVYDSHEYFTGVPELQNRPFVRWIWKSIEKSIFPKLKYVITVSDSIADTYKIEYGIRPLTVRNCSHNTSSIKPILRSEIGIPTDHLLLVYQGTGINVSRGGDELIDAISLTQNVTLLIIGSGDALDTLKSKVRELKLGERVRFIDKLPWTELMKYTKSADAGLSLDKNNNLNYAFSLPNKLFDYLSAGIPVIAGDLPEVSKIISENNCGIIISEVTSHKISEALNELLSNPDKLSLLQKNAVIASQKLNWETESEIVTKLYKEILGLKGAVA